MSTLNPPISAAAAGPELGLQFTANTVDHLKISVVLAALRCFCYTNILFKLVSDENRPQKLESYTIQASIDKWSKLEISTPVTKISAASKSLVLENGKEFTYTSFVWAPSFKHFMEPIKDLADMADDSIGDKATDYNDVAAIMEPSAR